ncbi:MAG: PKD domain-containing protein, partial [Dehalococcoidia bacterium]|nr:PKD domain-containing protein [Dehalococcoidia bacterium]
DLSVDVSSGPAPLSVTFTNLSTGADEFRWDFGDGADASTQAVGEPVSHEFTMAGTHAVILTAVKHGGIEETDTATLTVTVEPGPLDHIKVEPPAPSLVAGHVPGPWPRCRLG